MTLAQRARRGFTLQEVVITVAVLAILLGLAAPPLFQLIRQRDSQAEANQLEELRRALTAYVADREQLPSFANWAEDLAGYTSLSVAEMQNDTWGVPRAIMMYTDTTRNVQGAQVPVNYVTFHSAGPDRSANPAAGIAVDMSSGQGRFAGTGDLNWWPNFPDNTQRVDAFARLATTGDDLMVKFTDYADKLARYNLTIQRMDRITAALDSYARARYTNEVARCATLPRNALGLTGDPLCDTPGRLEVQTNYYPRSLAISAPNDNATYYTSTLVVNNQQNDAGRRDDMIGLMRMLGLGDDFCCSALLQASDNQPMPFYYFSNPRPRNNGGGCGARPGANGPYLPPRLTTINNDSATPPTCG